MAVVLPAAGGSQQSLSSSVSSSSTDTWSTYNLEWLFDPDRIDHLPIEEQLKHYAQQDLKKTKVYKYASKIWGAPLSRKRFIVAPPMYDDNDRTTQGFVQQTNITSDLQPQKPMDQGPSKQIIEEQIAKDKLTSYKKWIEERKGFRSNLDNMGLNIEYLQKKTDKTPLEKRVLRQMLDVKYPKRPPTPPREESPLEAVMGEEVPLVQRPSPMAIKVIERFLHERKMRLIDLFRSVDKDKDWKVTRDEFRTAIKKAQIPISEVLLEDLILALDADLNNELDYRELAKGMGLWKIEKRESKRKDIFRTTLSASPSKYSQMSGFDTPDPLERLDTSSNHRSRAKAPPTTAGSVQEGSRVKPKSRGDSRGGTAEEGKGDGRPNINPRTPGKIAESSSMPTITAPPSRGAPPPRVMSALSTISFASSTHLLPPEVDTREESRVQTSAEAMLDLRKRDREALTLLGQNGRPTATSSPNRSTRKRENSLEAKSVLRTGDVAIDNHLTPSLLGGETGEQVNRFRQLRYKEYSQICRLCQQRNIPLSEGLLKKVLLFPPDRAPKEIRRQLRQSAMPLHSQHFADPPAEPEDEVVSPTQEEQNEKNSKKMKVSVDGRVEVLVDSRQAYPKRSKVAPVPHKVTLSSGKAVIRRQVDCWLTFEEYEKLTRNLATRYINLHGHTDDNAFWPGHLLDKVQLCLPDNPPLSSSVFHNTSQKPSRSHEGRKHTNTGPVSSDRYVQFATIAK